MVIFHSFFLVGGFSPSPLKNDGVKVSWDEIPNILWKFMEHKIYVPSHQPFFYVYQRVRPLSAQIGDGDVGFTTLNVILRMNMYKLSIVSGLLDVLASFTS